MLLFSKRRGVHRRADGNAARVQQYPPPNNIHPLLQQTGSISAFPIKQKNIEIIKLNYTIYPFLNFITLYCNTAGILTGFFVDAKNRVFILFFFHLSLSKTLSKYFFATFPAKYCLYVYSK